MAQPDQPDLRQRADHLVKMIRQQIRYSREACDATRRIIALARENRENEAQAHPGNHQGRR